MSINPLIFITLELYLNTVSKISTQPLLSTKSHNYDAPRI